MKKERKVWAMTLIAFWWLAPNLIQAQQDSIPSTSLEELIITATKFPKDVTQTGKVINVIDSARLARSAGQDISQLLNEQVGMIVNGANSNPGKDKSLFLRGAGSGYSLILLDGIPLNDPSGVGGVFDLRLLPLDQIERIEVLKGSQSTLYGTDAIAGVVNLITKKKASRPVTGGATIGYGSFNSLKGSVSLSGSTKALSYSVSYSRYTTDGISEAKDSTGAAGYDNDGFTQDAVQGSVGFNIGKSLELRPYFRYHTFDGRYDASGFTDSRVNKYITNLFNTGITGQVQLPKGSINLLYGYDKTDRTFNSQFGVTKFYGRFQHAEAYWKANLTKSFQFLTGLSYQDIHMLDQLAAVTDPDVRIVSPYASVYLNPTKGLNIEVGGRLNVHSNGNNFTYSFNPSYVIRDHYKIFFNASSGFKVPTLNQLYGQFGPNPDLKPETSSSLEAGVQLFSADKNLDFRFSVFSRDLSNVIHYSFDPITSASKYVNLNEQKDQGFELEATARLSKDAKLTAFYAFVDGYLVDRSSGTEVKTYNLIRRPKNSLGLNLGNRFGKNLFASLNLKWFGERSDSYFNSSTFVIEAVTMDPYTLLDLYVEYQVISQRLKVFADTKNILNQDYMEVYGYNTMGFNVMAGVNLVF